MFEQVFLYCERHGPGIWAEPLNTVTNLAFLLGAVIAWRFSRGVPAARVLAVELGVIGLASLAFHATALQLFGALDSLSIVVFAVTYLYLANRHFVGLGRWPSAGLALLYVPVSLVMAPVFRSIPWLALSPDYWTLPALFALYGLGLIRKLPGVAAGLLGAGVLLSVSILARSVDRVGCFQVPSGTHWGWHILNAILLTGLTWLMRRHLAGRGGGR